MEILFIGDIVGRPGRECVYTLLPDLIDEYGIDFVIANGENVTHGKGLSKEHMLEMLENGVDAITLGNHSFAKKDIFNYIDDYEEVIRPYNLHSVFPGRGTSVFEIEGKTIRVTNLLGRVYMGMNVENPFDSLNDIVENDSLSLEQIWNAPKRIERDSKIAYADRQNCLFPYINKFVCDRISKKIHDFEELLQSCKIAIAKRGNCEIQHIDAEINIIKGFSREKAVSELIKSRKLEERISSIKSFIKSLEWGVEWIK